MPRFDRFPHRHSVNPRLLQHEFPGLGILLVDLLASQDGYVDEEAICTALRLSQKNVRKVRLHSRVCVHPSFSLSSLHLAFLPKTQPAVVQPVV